jgi:hypothetical protein
LAALSAAAADPPFRQSAVLPPFRHLAANPPLCRHSAVPPIFLFFAKYFVKKLFQKMLII